jgi:hypothetical protein
MAPPSTWSPTTAERRASGDGVTRLALSDGGTAQNYAWEDAEW